MFARSITRAIPFMDKVARSPGRWERAISNHAGNLSGPSTRRNLLVDETTRVLYQGFTGKGATSNAIDAITHGTKVVGGVSQGNGGTIHLGLPVFDDISQAVKQVKPDASLVYVPAVAAGNAIEKAIEAEVPLIVSIAEHIPVHDMLRVHQILRTQSASRLLGPNTPGILAPSKCRLGIIPNNQCVAGKVGILSRSGTMVYEAVGATGRVGLGQSLIIGLGGDLMPGTSMDEALQVLLEHDETEAIILIGEIGGIAEFKAAEVIQQYQSSPSDKPKKPIVAIISGRTAPEGRVMGHAGALLSPGEQGAEAKARALESAGATVLPHLGMLETTLRQIMA